jgi:hypothetical protein
MGHPATVTLSDAKLLKSTTANPLAPSPALSAGFLPGIQWDFIMDLSEGLAYSWSLFSLACSESREVIRPQWTARIPIWSRLMSDRHCRYCQQLFHLSRYHPHQLVCSRPACQGQRRREYRRFKRRIVCAESQALHK